MNKKTIITILLALVAMAGQAQEIKKVAATPEDFMEHMALCGYEVFTFDISSLRDSVSGFTIVIREYNQQGMIDEKKLYGFRTKTMISDFNEKDQQEIYAENDADDMERGIYRLAKTLAVGFSPVQSDSIETITLRSSRCDASPRSSASLPNSCHASTRPSRFRRNNSKYSQTPEHLFRLSPQQTLFRSCRRLFRTFFLILHK